MGPNPNVLCCGFQSGLAQVTVQVSTSTPLSQHHPCRDIDLMSRHQLKSLQPSTDVYDVATSISCRDITLCLRRCQLVAHDVATLAQVICRLQMVASDVATSISCRDINLMNCSFQLMTSVVATSTYAFAGFN